MKIKKYIVIVVAGFGLFFFVSCLNDSGADVKGKNDSLQKVDDSPGELLNQRSFQVTNEGDTINVKDENHLKQGLWVTNTGIKLSNGGFKKDTVYYKDGEVQKK